MRWIMQDVCLAAAGSGVRISITVEEARQARHAFASYGGEAVRVYGVAEELLT